MLISASAVDNMQTSSSSVSTSVAMMTTSTSTFKRPDDADGKGSSYTLPGRQKASGSNLTGSRKSLVDCSKAD